MSMGKVVAVTVITAAATSAATFFGLRALTESGRNAEVPVPELTGLRLEEARSLLEARKLALSISDTVEDARVEAGRIVRQSPTGGTLRAGTEVKVVLSAGLPKVEVPSVLRLPLPTAIELLNGAGLRPGQITNREGDRDPPGQVLESHPAPGQKATRGSAVDLVVSTGAPETKVPSVVGRTQAQATQLLTAAGFKVGRVTFGYDEDRRAGVVIRQTPAADSAAPRGSAVNLVMNESD